MTEFPLLLAAAVVLSLAAPGGAIAATFDVRFVDGTRSQHLLVIDRDRNDDGNTTVTIDQERTDALKVSVGRDTVGTIPKECRRTFGNGVECPRETVDIIDEVQIRLGNGDDTVITKDVFEPLDIEGRAGADVLMGGRSGDTIDVGEGVRIGDAVPSKMDEADGGPGDDVLRQVIAPRQQRFDGDTLSNGAILRGGIGNDTITASPSHNVDRVPHLAYGIPSATGHNLLDGGSGNDTITGGSGIDNINGDEGDDTIVGNGGGDLIDGRQGADTITSGAGNDLVFAGPGADSVTAGSGNDTVSDGLFVFSSDPDANVTAADGADVFSGGLGQDTLTYTARSSRLELSPNDQTANDGAPGERDQILGFEKVRSGAGNDFLFGLVSLDDGFADDWFGGSGDDLMLSGDGDDRLEGGRGRDTLRAGSGDDVLLTRDGEPDAEISCGSGIDEAFIDLTDPDPVSTNGISSCERIERQPIREEPNVRLRGGTTFRRTAGRVRIPLACLRAARRGCRGAVTLRLGSATHRASYRLRRGRRTTVTLRAPRTGAGTLVAVQRGKTGRRKTTTIQVRIR